MKAVDIEFNNHEDYIYLLKRMKHLTEYIQLVQIDNDENDPVILKAKESMELIKKRKVNQWPGTKRKGDNVTQYTFRKNNYFWRYLSSFESFFFSGKDAWGCDTVRETTFGLIDIAFLDKDMNVIFFTVTHEGIAMKYSI